MLSDALKTFFLMPAGEKFLFKNNSLILSIIIANGVQQFRSNNCPKYCFLIGDANHFLTRESMMLSENQKKYSEVPKHHDAYFKK